MKLIDCETPRSVILRFANDFIQRIRDEKNDPNFVPTLAVLQIEGDDASSVYVRNKKKACESCGIKFMHLKFPNDVSYMHLRTALKTLARDSKITGILLQLPLPERLKKYEADLINMIPWQKDVDGLTATSIGRLWSGMECLRPCTAEAIMTLLPNDLSGQNVLVINRSMLIGKPLVALLQERNATVTLAHSKSMLGHELLCMPDIIITAVGKHGYLNDLTIFEKTWLPDVDEDCMIIDAAITRDDNGKICGDIDFDRVDTKAQITPVPGGVGVLTTAMVACNVAYAANLQERYPL